MDLIEIIIISIIGYFSAKIAARGWRQMQEDAAYAALKRLEAEKAEKAKIERMKQKLSEESRE